MKKSIIALSVAAALGGVAGTASAQTDMQFAARGTGQVVVIPYFSTQSGNMTLLNIVNTDTVNGKAVKVRFRGASNSDDVFDFQLFLSPGDVWAANIATDSAGVSRLATNDKSCTLPANVNQSFITSRLNPALSAEALANETREGYVEIFTMGDIPLSTSSTSLYVATKHNSSGVAPCTTATLESLTRFDTRINNPTIGLMANWTIVNVPQTTTWSGEAPALRVVNTSTGNPTNGTQVFFPQTADSLTVGDVTSYTADPLFRIGAVAGASYDLPDLSTPYHSAVSAPIDQANALSHAIAAQVVAAEYLTDPTITASTDWIISNPFRRYYVAVDYVGSTTGGPKLITNFEDNNIADAVYYRKTDDTASPQQWKKNVVLRGFQACALVDAVSFRSREEQSVAGTNIVISPGTPVPAPELCGEVSALGINSGATTSPSPTIKAAVARSNVDVSGGFRDGWGTLTSVNSVFGVTLGLPQFTTQYVRAFNPAASAGFSGTFAGRWNSRTLVTGQAW